MALPERAWDRFPIWGDATDLVRLIDVRCQEGGSFSSPPDPAPPLGTFLEIPEEHRPRRLIEAGHLLGQAIVAAAKSVSGKRVVSASMILSRMAFFDQTTEVEVEVMHEGRQFSTVAPRTSQSERLCSASVSAAPACCRWMPARATRFEPRLRCPRCRAPMPVHRSTWA